MLRQAASTSSGRAAAAAGLAAAAAATPSATQCRAETVAAPPQTAEARAKTPTHPPAATPPPPAWTAVPDDWVDAAAAITDADVVDAVQTVLRVVSPPPAAADEEAGAIVASPPGAVMAAADARQEQAARVRADFETALTSLLSNGEVRAACTRALAANPAFAGLLRTVGAHQVDALLPLAAQAAARLTGGGARGGGPGSGDGDPVAAFFEALAGGLVALGKGLGGAAAAVGKVAIEAGYRIHRLVTAPFGATPHYLAGPHSGGRSSHIPRRPCADAPLGSPEYWIDVLTTVACVVVSVLLVKRLPRGRPAGAM